MKKKENKYLVNAFLDVAPRTSLSTEAYVT